MTVTTTIIYRRTDMLYDKKIAQQCNDVVTAITSYRIRKEGEGGRVKLGRINNHEKSGPRFLNEKDYNTFISEWRGGSHAIKRSIKKYTHQGPGRAEEGRIEHVRRRFSRGEVRNFKRGTTAARRSFQV